MSISQENFLSLSEIINIHQLRLNVFKEDMNITMNMEPQIFANSSTLLSDFTRANLQVLHVQMNDGLTLASIEETLLLMLIFRLIILTIRYNLKTSFYITCIGVGASYLWYRHLVDLIFMYRNILLNIPFLENLALNSFQLRDYNLQESNIGENVPWYNIGQVIYYAIIRGICYLNVDTGLKYYRDPLSMIISTLDESTKNWILPLYYKLYIRVIPEISKIFSSLWVQLSGVAAYGLITRIGKRYCPYLIRWHWTFLLVISLFEPFIEYFLFRSEFFGNFLLTKANMGLINISNENQVELQLFLLNLLVNSIILLHVGFIIFGLLHAVCGQYFYFPFLIENVELHIGPRPKASVYSGGNTAWQNIEEKKRNENQFFPKIWYGWFGRGTVSKPNTINFLKNMMNSLFSSRKKRY